MLASFKSCPREGASSQSRSDTGLSYQVSSHAPVRGHHLRVPTSSEAREVSSHAPVRGHRLANSFFHPTSGFKSCPREGASATIVVQILPT